MFIIRARVVFILEGAGEFFQYVTDAVGILLQIFFEEELGRKAARFADVFDVRFSKSRSKITTAISALLTIDDRKYILVISMDYFIEVVFVQF